MADDFLQGLEALGDVELMAPPTQSGESSPTGGGNTSRRNSTSVRVKTEKKDKKDKRRREARDADVIAGSVWACTVCTMENQPDSTVCVACETPKSEMSGWVCKKCGFVNQDEAGMACDSCRARRPAPEASAAPLTTRDATSGAPVRVKTEAGVRRQATAPTAVEVKRERNSTSVKAERTSARTSSSRAQQNGQPTADYGSDEESEISELSPSPYGSDMYDGEFSDDEEYEESAEDEEHVDEDDIDEPDPLDPANNHSRPNLSADLTSAVATGPASPTSPRNRRPPGDLPANAAREVPSGDDDDDDDELFDEDGAPLRTKSKLTSEQKEDIRGMMDQMTSVNPQSLPDFEPHPNVRNAQLKDFQRAALGWLVKRENEATPEFPVRGGIFADYMGLGKTRTMISLCETNRQEGINRATSGDRVRSNGTLVVCPVSLMEQWANEIRTVVRRPNGEKVKILKYHGTGRKLSIFDLAKKDYVLVSYHTLASEYVSENQRSCKINAIHWYRMVLDEAHYIRNEATKISRACAHSRLDADRRWAMTATPVQNRLEDLHPLLKFLRLPQFSDKQIWYNEVVRPVMEENSRAIAVLQKIMSSIVLRREPSTIVNGKPILVLPEKKIDIISTPLLEEEQDFHDAIKQRSKLRLDALMARNTKVGMWACVFEMLIRCRQACLHPFIVVASELRKGKTYEVDTGTAEGAAEAGEQIEKFMHRLQAQLSRNNGGQVTEFAQKIIDKIESGDITKEDCIICMDTIQEPAILPCGHYYCFECISRAVETMHKCPMCKSKMGKKDVKKAPEAPKPPPPPNEFEDVARNDPEHLKDPTRWKISSRMKAICEEIKNIPADEKVVVFSQFHTFLIMIQSMLRNENITCEIFSGKLSHQDRDILVHNFQNKDDPRVLLATIQTCGVGLNLTRASHAFSLDPCWNPGLDEQAMNRIHRIGQTRKVRYCKFVAKGTIEDKIEELAEKKRQLAKMSLGNKEAARFSLREMVSLFD